MERLFQKSMLRNTICLDGEWTITYDPDRKGETLGYGKGAGLSSQVCYVPSCWNFDLGRYDYAGVAWYARRVVIRQSTHARLVFHAVSGQAEVYLDGKKLGAHYGGYTRFSFDIPDLAAGDHLLVVKVDNAVNDRDTLPLTFVDWYVYGGIYRSVELELLDGLSVDRVKIDTDWEGYRVDTVRVAALIKNWSPEPITDEFTLSIDGRQVSSATHTINPQDAREVLFELDDLDVELWDCHNPKLYLFSVSCAIDDLCERTGFRKIERQDRKILLNGHELFIRGINRHNDHPDLGHAIHGPLILRDLQIIKDLGCNSVRGSHYPNDPIVLDYCDQMGLLFWEEVAFWNHPAEALASPKLEERARTMMREMIERDYNHPSIIFWSIQNESKSSSKEGLELFTKIAQDIRAMDTSRLITFASACGRNDICFGLVDVVCWNMYPGWYDDDKPLDGLGERFTKSLAGIRQWLIEQGQDKPFIVSEFGAGAILGVTTFDEGRRWTENYQEKLLCELLSALQSSPDVQGFYIWQYCDCRTALMSKVSIGRPRTFNNKGLVDEYRRPKRAYYSVRDMFKNATPGRGGQ